MFDRFRNILRAGSRVPNEPQTASLGAVRQEYALHPSRGLTPARLAQVLEEAELGDLTAQCDLAEDMEEKDAHIHAELSKRRRAILGLERQIEPPRDANAAEKRTTDFIKELFADLDLDDLLLDLGDAILKGYAPIEIDWQKRGQQRFPRLELIPQRWLQLPHNQPYSNELRLRNNTAEGEALIPGGWLVHLHKAKPGYIARASLARILTWPYLYKNYSTRDLAEFLEIYGLPLVMGTYPRGAGDKEKSTLLRAVTSIGHAARGIMPEGMAIEIHDAAQGQSDPYQAMMDWAERSESKAIVGQVLSAEAKSTGMGSGVADLQGEVRDDIITSDAGQMSRTLTKLCYLVAIFNGHQIDPGRGPQYRLFVEDSDDLTAFSEAIPKLVAVGTKIPERWVHDRLKIPEAEAGEAILAAPAAPAPMPSPRPEPTATNTITVALAAQPAQDAEATPIDALSNELEKEAADPWKAILDHVQHIIDTAPTLAAARDAILSAYADLPTEKLANVMAAARTAAQAAGRYAVTEEDNAPE